MGIKAIVCGGRDWPTFSKEQIEFIYDCIQKYDIDEIVSGGARGADSIIETLCNIVNFPFVKLDADWERYGKRGGYVRNSDMLDYIGDDGIVIAFPGGKGTANMTSIATENGNEVLYVKQIQI